MTSNTSHPPADKTEQERRKGLTEPEIKKLELAGGVEGGMQAGSGGPRPGRAPSAEPSDDQPTDEEPRT
jgi:hypothetical protein